MLELGDHRLGDDESFGQWKLVSTSYMFLAQMLRAPVSLSIFGCGWEVEDSRLIMGLYFI
jgi:hypothetical protein